MHTLEKLALTLLVALLPLAGVGRAGDVDAPARFVVTPRVAVEDPPAFGMNLISSSLVMNSFIRDATMEPRFYNWRMTARGGGRRHIDLPPTPNETDGFWTGGVVRAYRIGEEAIEHVRSGRIVRHRSSGFLPATREGQALTNAFYYSFDDAGATPPSPDALPVWFKVVAVDAAGNESPGAVGKGYRAAARHHDRKQYQRFLGQNETVDVAAGGDKGGPQPPSDVQVRGVEPGINKVTWTPSESDDVVGYRVYRSFVDPRKHTGWGLDLAEDGPEVRDGDMLMIQVHHPDWPSQSRTYVKNWTARNRASGWRPELNEDFGQAWQQVGFDEPNPAVYLRRVPHPGELPREFRDEWPGRQCLEAGTSTDAWLNLRSSAVVSPRGKPPHSAPAFGVNALAVGRSYTFEAWAMSEDVDEVVVEVGSYQPELKKVFPLAKGRWTKLIWRFTPTKYPFAHDALLVSIKGPGTIHLDNVFLYETAAGGPGRLITAHPTLEGLRDFMGPGSQLRIWSGHSNVGASLTLDDWVRPERRRPENVGSPTLPTALEIARKVGAEPWLIVTPAFSESDWAGLIEYLAAPYDPAVDGKPGPGQDKYWARRRYELGRQKPWTDEMKIWIEVGNELWNGSFVPWAMFPASLHGKWSQYCMEQVSASQYYDDERIKFYVGGRGPYDNQAMIPAEYATLAVGIDGRGGYLGGWELGYTVGSNALAAEDYLEMGTLAPIFNRKVDAFLARHSATAKELGVHYHVHEFNSGYDHRAQHLVGPELVGKSLIAGTANLDVAMYRALRGYEAQCYFFWGFGRTWSSHTYLAEGAHASTTLLSVKMRNKYARGDMLVTEARGVPTVDIPKLNRNGAQEDLPLVTCYAFRDGDRYSVLVLSTKVKGAMFDRPEDGIETVDFGDGSTPVTLDLPFKAVDAQRSRVYKLTGDPTDHNITDEKVRIESAPLGEFTAPLEFSLPAGSVYLFVLEGAE
jgi:hypothetical protein